MLQNRAGEYVEGFAADLAAIAGDIGTAPRVDARFGEVMSIGTVWVFWFCPEEISQKIMVGKCIHGCIIMVLHYYSNRRMKRPKNSLGALKMRVCTIVATGGCCDNSARVLR